MKVVIVYQETSWLMLVRLFECAVIAMHPMFFLFMIGSVIDSIGTSLLLTSAVAQY